MPLSALDLLETLASGRDFRTGEVLPPAHLLNNPEVIRALHWSIRMVSESQEKLATSPSATLENQGKSWGEDEEAILRESFSKAIPIARIAKVHGRTPGSIRSRLQKLSLIQG